jgi:hypothetical protein
VIGVIGGLGLVRNAVVEQMQDMAASIQDLQVQPEDTMTMMALPEGSGVQTPSGDQNATE